MTQLAEVVARYVAVAYILMQTPTIGLAIWVGYSKIQSNPNRTTTPQSGQRSASRLLPAPQFPFGMSFAILVAAYITSSTVILLVNINSPSHSMAAGAAIANLVFLTLTGTYITLFVEEPSWKHRFLPFYCLQFGICMMLYMIYLLFKHNIGEADSTSTLDESVGIIAIILSGTFFLWCISLYIWQSCNKKKQDVDGLALLNYF